MARQLDITATERAWKTSILFGASALALLSILVYAGIAQLAVQNSEGWSLLAWLIFLIPGLLVLLGTYAHVAKRRHWGVVLLWTFGIVNALIIVLTFPGVAIAFQQHTWIVGILVLELLLTILVLVTSVVLAFVQRSAAQQIVGPERRGRVL
jgi:hypothetical protein